MKEQPGIVSTQEFLEHVFSLAASTFDFDGLQYSNDVLHQKFSVVSPLCHSFVFSSIWVEKSEHF